MSALKAINNLNTHALALAELAKFVCEQRHSQLTEAKYGSQINMYVADREAAIRAAFAYFGVSP